MQLQKFNLAFAIAAGGALLCAPMAQADSVDQQIGEALSADGTDGQPFGQLILNDSDRSVIINPDGSQKTDGMLEEGDIIVGSIKIDSVDSDPTDSNITLLDNGLHQGLTGVYAGKVESIQENDPNSDESALVTFNPLTNSDIEGAGLDGTDDDLKDNVDLRADENGNFGENNTLIAFFTDGDASGNGSADDAIYNGSSNELDIDGASDGGLWQAFGDGEYRLRGNGTGDVLDPAAAAGESPNGEPFLANASLNLTSTMDGSTQYEFIEPLTEDDVPGTNNASEINYGGGGFVGSDISFRTRVIPTPSTMAGGLALLSMLGVGAAYRKRCQAA